jgi:MSHA pilin protein MshC
MTIANKNKSSGFSLFELVLVIILLGILSVYALSSFFDQDEIAARGIFDDTVNAVRFAQKLAVSTGCDVRVATVAAGYSLLQSSTCTANDFTNPVVNPANRGNNYQNLNVPGSFSLAPTTTITFNARGIPDSRSDVAFTITDGVTSYSFNVDGQTGLVW